MAATWLLDRFKFGVLAVAGIAGALEPELRLGDVVIASSVDEYLVAARATAGLDRYNFEVAGVSWVAGRDLVTYAHNFRYLGGGFEAWQRRAAARLPVASELARPEPDYLVGPIASGDVVGADEAFAQWLRQHNRFRAALEMEAGGVARAIYRSGQTELLVVRGISDFADKRKQDLDATAGPGGDRGAWRQYAALNAVDLLAALVTNPAFPGPPRARRRPSLRKCAGSGWPSKNLSGSSAVTIAARWSPGTTLPVPATRPGASIWRGRTTRPFWPDS